MRTLLVISAACLFVACGDRDSAGKVRTETLSSGTIRVRNPETGAWTRESAWRAVEDLRLGSGDGTGADVFAAPVALEADESGRLYVLDAQASEVRVFDPNGRHMRTMGRQGKGPGELAGPLGMALAPDGALWVVDPGNGRFTVFDSAGAPRTTVRRNNGLSVYPWPGRFDSRGRLWDVASGADLAAAPTLLRMDPASMRAERFALPAASTQHFSLAGKGSRTVALVPFTPQLAWTVGSDGRVWSGVTGSYRLAQWEPGGDTLRIVERAGAPVPVSAAERDSVPLQLKWFTDQGGKVDLSRVPRTKPAYLSVMTDDRGWLWVRPSQPAGQAHPAFDVFDPEGGYQGRVTLPAAVQPEAPVIVRGSQVYAVAMAEAGYPQVVRFRLQGRP